MYTTLLQQTTPHRIDIQFVPPIQVRILLMSTFFIDHKTEKWIP